MITEAMWDQVNQISMIANVLLNAVLVSVFYIPFMRKRVRAVILGAVYAMAMSILYFATINFSGVTAYALGCAAVCIISAITERINIRQKKVNDDVSAFVDINGTGNLTMELNMFCDIFES